MIVASFFTPREDRWGCDYHACLRVLQKSCDKFGLRHVVLSDAQQAEFETFITPLPENLMLALVEAQRAFLAATPGPILLVGADCILTADPRNELDGHDIAITIGPFTDCEMNTGAIWIANGPTCAPVWADALAQKPTKWGDDQRAIYGAIQASGLKVRRLDCQTHNWAPTDIADRAYLPMVAHFRGNRKQWMAGWYERFVA